MKVYILESGMNYEGSTIDGVYTTLEAAKNAVPDADWQEKTVGEGSNETYWVAKNLKDWYPEWYSITEHEVIE